MSAETLRQVATFVVCGVASAGCYTTTLVGLVELVGWPTWLATTAGFAVGTWVSYVLNARFTFRRAMEGRTLIRFTSVTLAGWGLNVGLVEGAGLLGLNYGFGVVASLIIAPAFNFMGHRLVTFRGAG